MVSIKGKGVLELRQKVYDVDELGLEEDIKGPQNVVYLS